MSIQDWENKAAAFDKLTEENAKLREHISELEIKLKTYENDLGILTVERAKELFDYDKGEGVLIWRVSMGSIKAGSKVTSVNCKGYVNVKIGHKGYQAHRVVWMIHYGVIPTSEIDHINRIKSDNRIDNLRCVSHSENIENIGLRSNNKSGYVGVYKVRNKWSAQIRVKGKAINLGLFDAIESAVIARKQSEEKYRCKTN